MVSVFDNILQCKSISVVGMAKNTGKTECLNYILQGCARRHHPVGLTSIGLDGETLDQVTATDKPEISITRGTLFVTAEKLYHRRQVVSEIMDVSSQSTALGRLIMARAISPGKVMLAGPTATARLQSIIKQMQTAGAKTVFIDGALSRKSQGSPAITEGIVLTTGAALSPNIAELVRKTSFVYQLLNLPSASIKNTAFFLEKETGIYAVPDEKTCINLDIPSAFLLSKHREKIFAYGSTLFVNGAVSDQLLDFLRAQPSIRNTILIVRDFTRIFATPTSLRAYLQKGGQLQVLLRPHLLCICVNPWSPAGYILDSKQVREELEIALQIPVYDVKTMPFQ